MTLRGLLTRLPDLDVLNFWLTNYIPRRLATRFVGWLARIEQPLVRDASIAVWRQFSDLDLSEAKDTHFKSLRDCFERHESAFGNVCRHDIGAHPQQSRHDLASQTARCTRYECHASCQCIDPSP